MRKGVSMMLYVVHDVDSIHLILCWLPILPNQQFLDAFRVVSFSDEKNVVQS